MAHLAMAGPLVVTQEVLGGYRVHAGSMLNGDALRNARSRAFLLDRLRLQRTGVQLSLEEFERRHPITMTDRRIAVALASYQRARVRALERHFAVGAAWCLAAVVAWPEMIPRLVKGNLARWSRAS